MSNLSPGDRLLHRSSVAGLNCDRIIERGGVAYAVSGKRQFPLSECNPVAKPNQSPAPKAKRTIAKPNRRLELVKPDPIEQTESPARQAVAKALAVRDAARDAIAENDNYATRSALERAETALDTALKVAIAEYEASPEHAERVASALRVGGDWKPLDW